MKGKEKMKKLLTLMLIITFLSLLFNVIAFAEDSESEDTAPPETSVENENEAVTEPSFADTVIAVVKEALGSNFMAIATTAIDVVLLVIIGLLRSNTKDNTKKVLSIVASANKSNTEKWTELSSLAEENKKHLADFKVETKAAISCAVEKAFKEYNVPTVTHEQLAEVVTGMKAIMDMFEVVYQHSGTIPAAIKEQLAKTYNGAVEHISTLEEVDTSVTAGKVHNS